MHRGQKVAFCCASCPVAWDKLSDSDKDEKLTKVVRSEGHTGPEADEHGEGEHAH